MPKSFEEKLLASSYLHRPLEVPTDKALETRLQQKEVLTSKIVMDADTPSEFHHRGVGKLERTADNQLRLSSPVTMPHWPEGAPDDGDYCNFGSVYAVQTIDRQDWTTFNRVRIEVFPEFEGLSNAYITIQFKNDGLLKVPDIYDREGVHGVNLVSDEWNDVIIEIADLPRDAITELSISYYLQGPEKLSKDNIALRVRSIHLETIETPENTKGWLPNKNVLSYAHNGYAEETAKTAFADEAFIEMPFELLDAKTKSPVFAGVASRLETELGVFAVLDFSNFKEVGSYYLQIGDIKTRSFPIGDMDLKWTNSIWKSLNFIFCERCGYPIPGKHATCHADIVAEHDGKILSFNGGWHDAGDVSQQLIQTAEVTMALYEAAATQKNNPLLYGRLIEEGEWGADFLLKTRFGDGYRATSAGMSRWTDGLIGGMDDAEARVHNQAYENFYCAGIEAYIHARITTNDALKRTLKQIAVEDFDFALAEMTKHGIHQKPIFWEHTYQTSESLYYATAAFSAAMLYQITQDSKYEAHLTTFLENMLACQEQDGITGDNGTTYAGFFYRNKEHKIIQHFNHQAREHLYLLALEQAMIALPNHESYAKWYQAVELYGNYIKQIMPFVAPYPLIPAGFYHKDEYLDDASFELQHLLVDERAREEYQLQYKEGIPINQDIALRKFPIWFSFRGNNAILLSAGKACSIAGTILNDEKLLKIAEGQLEWIVGKNPFGQSMMYGEGDNYAQQYSVLNGEMVGEIPVGVQTFRNEDQPYWPQFNNATYKEVWVGNAGKWLAIVADLLK
ncbi:endoglucanase [Listeria booriae]|uniref:Endoglucanase n=1 Tax=Listeria booriae TaxID=1552123 RepID=A0A842B981_9LIST|nr:glycoside hydrolase family 9 protein [Listeria booriae]MBC1798375.1 endoglucanase [Listeria booriae]